MGGLDWTPAHPHCRAYIIVPHKRHAGGLNPSPFCSVSFAGSGAPPSSVAPTLTGVPSALNPTPSCSACAAARVLLDTAKMYEVSNADGGPWAQQRASEEISATAKGESGGLAVLLIREGKLRGIGGT